MKNKILKQLKSNIDLMKKIESLMIKIDIKSDNEKDMLLVGFSRNILMHFLSINYLIEKELYNSAFALVRVFFENIIKLRYIYHIMNEVKIKKIYKTNNWNNHFPTIKKMVEQIDNEIGMEFYSKIKDNAYPMMNDYVHTGANQIASNFTESAVESKFNNELILDTLKGNRKILKTSIIIFLEDVGLRNGFISENEIKDYLKY